MPESERVVRVYSVCAACSARCPIEVEVENGAIKHIWGNPHLMGGRYLCPRGAAQKVFQTDTERVQYPMIRDGERGSGKWRKASWEEALDYVAEKLRSIMDQYGGESVVLGDRGGPFTDLHKAFIKALGSPNYFNQHACCSNSVHNAHNAMAGQRRNTVTYDWKKCRYTILYSRNILESLGTKEAKDFIDARERGMKVVYLDARWTYTAAKSDRFFILRPGTDYAFNLALIHVIVKERLYDEEFVRDWVVGMRELTAFIEPYTPEWAESETGISAAEIRKVAREVSEAAPSVIFHQGWMTARSEDDYYFRRSIYILYGLLGAYEAPGGLLFNKNETHCGYKPLRKFVDLPPKVEKKRFDGIGWKYKHLSADYGLGQMLPHAILNEDPYPIKAFLCYRFDPLSSFPDPETFQKGLKKLDLLVSVDVNYSHIAWVSDVILPEAVFLERTDPVIVKGGPKPALWIRRQAVEPRYDSKPKWWIIKQLAERLGVGRYFPYNTVEEMIAWQLQDMGFTLSDFEEKGCIELSGEPILFDRKSGLPFKTPSKKLEFVSSMLEENGIPSFPPYRSPEPPPKGHYRLITGKIAVHTQGTTLNNPYLNEIQSENKLWINSGEAGKLGIRAGDRVEVSIEDVTQRGIAAVSDFIHPEVVYTLHGYGREVPLQTRAYKKGMRDNTLMKGLLKVAVGGNCPLAHCYIRIRKASQGHETEEQSR
ncbi:MAG: molybdopterin-dependent oxidoreductase [Syntrophobacteraceae bacterium]|nr:molybdopterin-dependent oxidoreductase [Syntrophobacteraceae bacterium]